MTVLKQSLYKAAWKYGLTIAAIPTLFNIVLLLLGLHLDYQYYGEGIGVSYERATVPLMPAVLIFALIRFKRTNANSIKLSEAFKLWLRIYLVTCTIVVAYNVIFRTIIAPDFSNEFYEANRQEIFEGLIECCNYSQEALENHERTNGTLSNTISAFIFLNLIFGSVTTLVIGLILRKTGRKTA